MSREMQSMIVAVRYVGIIVLVGLGSACGSKPETAMPMNQEGMDMGEMDHSQHMMGASTDRQMVHLTPEQERALGVRYVTVQRRHLERAIRTVGRIVASESRIADVTPKVDGFVETLAVNTTGETVRAGQPLLTLYSPDLLAAQEELVIARRLVERVGDESAEAAGNAQAMLESARRRLRYWDITEEQIRRLEEGGEVTKALTLVSPVNGIVLEKSVNEGQRVMPGTMLYRIADLSEVWVEGEVFERDLALIEDGAEAHIEVNAFPGQHFMGRVDFVYPVMDVTSRDEPGPRRDAQCGRRAQAGNVRDDVLRRHAQHGRGRGPPRSRDSHWRAEPRLHSRRRHAHTARGRARPPGRGMGADPDWSHPGRRDRRRRELPRRCRVPAGDDRRDDAWNAVRSDGADATRHGRGRGAHP